MELLNLSIRELNNLFVNKKAKPSELYSEIFDRAANSEAALHAHLSLFEETNLEKAKNSNKNKKYPVLFYFYSEPAGQTGVNRYGAGNNSLYDGNLGEDVFRENIDLKEVKKQILQEIGRASCRERV